MLSRQRYAVVLAGGAGTRLKELTTNVAGMTVPKQFCTFNGGASLLRDTLGRIKPIVPRSQTCAVVSARHRRWWRNEVWSVPAANVLVQPLARGTGIGLLYALLEIERRDPEAVVLCTPADHHVTDPAVLATAMDDALIAASAGEYVVLLGTEPRTLDSQCGYISLGSCDGYGLYEVAEFVERPGDLARRVERDHVLWNSFILAGSCESLLDLVERRFPEIVSSLRGALARRDGLRVWCDDALSGLFQELPVIDFSSDVLAHSAVHLRALPLEECGIADLGTPERILETLREMRHRERDEVVPLSGAPDLAAAAMAARSQDRIL
jgi:mannose-1-phosphate guanylyltransferase